MTIRIVPSRQRLRQLAAASAMVATLLTPGSALASSPDSPTLTIRSVVRTATSIQVVAVEETRLHFRKIAGDEPEFTAYAEEHVFAFRRQEGDWMLAGQRPLESGGIPPITEALDASALGDPGLLDPDASSTERTGTKLPADGKDVSRSSAGITPMAIPAGLDYAAMVAYAKKYWTDYNPAYRSFAGNGGDCTNFISQTLRAGGWKFASGAWTSPDVWWYNDFNQSYTWAGAENWSWFAPKRTTHLTNIWQMALADVLQLDWDKDGSMDHTMVVTKKTTSEIYMTYHTNDTLNRPLSELQAIYATKAWWYSYRT